MRKRYLAVSLYYRAFEKEATWADEVRNAGEKNVVHFISRKDRRQAHRQLCWKVKRLQWEWDACNDVEAT